MGDNAIEVGREGGREGGRERGREGLANKLLREGGGMEGGVDDKL